MLRRILLPLDNKACGLLLVASSTSPSHLSSSCSAHQCTTTTTVTAAGFRHASSSSSPPMDLGDLLEEQQEKVKSTSTQQQPLRKPPAPLLGKKLAPLPSMASRLKPVAPAPASSAASSASSASASDAIPRRRLQSVAPLPISTSPSSSQQQQPKPAGVPRPTMFTTAPNVTPPAAAAKATSTSVATPPTATASSPSSEEEGVAAGAAVTPAEIQDVVEFVKLLIPHGAAFDTGMLVTDIFSTLSPDQRLVVRRHSKMLSKFLMNYPAHFAVSPARTVVVIVETCDGNPNVALIPSDNNNNSSGDEQQQQQQQQQCRDESVWKDHPGHIRAKGEASLRALRSERTVGTMLQTFVKPAVVVDVSSPSTSAMDDIAAKLVVESGSSSSSSSAAATTASTSAAGIGSSSPPPYDQELFDRLERMCRADFMQHYTPVSAADEVLATERRQRFAALAAAEHAGIGPGPVHYDSARIVLETVPPPDLFAEDPARAGKAPLEKRRIEGMFETSLSTQTLVKFVPPWFVPCSEVVVKMGEGYTEEHFDMFFGDSAAVEVINLNGARFVRVHGGLKHKVLVDFEVPEAEIVEQHFAHYKPDPSLVPLILPFMPPRGQWTSLYDVVSRLPEELQKRLPFQGPLSLLFFAQMQHVFSFTPNKGGGICVPREMPTHLHWDSTPFVRVMHDVFGSLLGSKGVFVGELLDFACPLGKHGDADQHSVARMRQRREELVRGLMLARAVHFDSGSYSTAVVSTSSPQVARQSFPPQFAFECDVEKDILAVPERLEELLRVYVSLHKAMFAYQGEETGQRLEGFAAGSSDGGVSNNNNNNNNKAPSATELRTVLLRFEYEAVERHQLDLPTQIEIAKRRNNSKQLRKLRRRLAALTQPDNPLLEEEALAKAIAEFLPPDKHMSWMRIKKNLPNELLDLLPANTGKFLSKYPQHFKKFDVGIITSHHVALQVPHLPPPPGAFRQVGEYTKEELVSAVGQVLVRGPKTVSSLASALPTSINDSIRQQFGGVAQLVEDHPVNFALVIKDVRNKDLRTAVVTLLQVPNLITVEDDLVAAEQAAASTKQEIREMTAGATEMDAVLDDAGEMAAPSDVWGAEIEEQTGIKLQPGEGTVSSPPRKRMSGGVGGGGGGGGGENDLWTKITVGEDDSDFVSGSMKSSYSSASKHHHSHRGDFDAAAGAEPKHSNLKPLDEDGIKSFESAADVVGKRRDLWTEEIL